MSDGHHLVYGILKDYLTGENLRDTDDERIRQDLARYLTANKGYVIEDLEARLRHDVSGDGFVGHSVTDLAVKIDGRIAMVIRYGPGSLVTRERPALAAARILCTTHTVPLAVVTNGRDAEVLDLRDGSVIGYGLESIPDRGELARLSSERNLPPVGDRQATVERRILRAYDGIEQSCACTEDWCRPA